MSSKAKKAKKAARMIGPLTKFQQMSVQMENLMSKVQKKKRGKKGKSRNVNSSQSAGLNLKSSITNKGATTRRGQVIDEDEYIGEVNGSAAFQTTAYPVNPGQSSTFPWANKIASLYEKYIFRKLQFYYKREVSEFATNGTTGKVMLSCDYDASDAAPTTKQQVEDTVPHVDAMPCCETLVLTINCEEMHKGDAKFVRPGLQPVGTDIKTYDGANFYVSVQGCQNSNVIGELRVRYICELRVPVLPVPFDANLPVIGNFDFQTSQYPVNPTIGTPLQLNKNAPMGGWTESPRVSMISEYGAVGWIAPVPGTYRITTTAVGILGGGPPSGGNAGASLDQMTLTSVNGYQSNNNTVDYFGVTLATATAITQQQLVLVDMFVAGTTNGNQYAATLDINYFNAGTSTATYNVTQLIELVSTYTF